MHIFPDQVEIPTSKVLISNHQLQQVLGCSALMVLLQEMVGQVVELLRTSALAAKSGREDHAAIDSFRNAGCPGVQVRSLLPLWTCLICRVASKAHCGRLSEQEHRNLNGDRPSSLGVFDNQDEFDFDGIDLDAIVSARQRGGADPAREVHTAPESFWQTPPVPLATRPECRASTAPTSTTLSSATVGPPSWGPTRVQSTPASDSTAGRPQVARPPLKFPDTAPSRASFQVACGGGCGEPSAVPTAGRHGASDAACANQSELCPHGVRYSQCSSLDLHIAEIKERLLHISDQLLDGCCTEDLSSRLRHERKSLQALLSSIDIHKGRRQPVASPAQHHDCHGYAPQDNAQQHQHAFSSRHGCPTASTSGKEYLQTQAPQANSNCGGQPQNALQCQTKTYSCQPTLPSDTRMGGFEPQTLTEYMPDPMLRQGIGNDDPLKMDCKQSDGCRDHRWDGQFPWSLHLAQANQDYFGNSTFRPHQRQAINATMSGQDCFVLMPTGGGTPPKVLHSPEEEGNEGLTVICRACACVCMMGCAFWSREP